VASPSKSRPADRREQILNHALQLFVIYGIEHVTTRKIAQAVGISQPSLYAHFKGRDEIAIELSRRAFAQLGERMAVAAARDGSDRDRLHRLAEEYVGFGLEQTEVYRVAFMLEKAKLAPEDQQTIRMAGMQAFRIVHDLFKQVRNCDDDQTAALAQSAWASLHGLVALLLARPNFPWVDRDLLIRLHLDRVVEGAFA
jgi:AcrR family transcriptional regulator